MRINCNATRFFFLILLTVVGFTCGAQVFWDGEGNDGEWSNPINWSGNSAPGLADDVVLDNSLFPFPYKVSIGAGDLRIAVRSISIHPAPGSIIECEVPTTNTAVPAIRCLGNIYGLVLEPGAIFINASGASAGMTLEIEDSIRINNGGKFIHRTPRSHADNVRSLSRDTGTELGEFEFQIPVASSTISVSGQVFGKLKLSPGPNGIINYTGTGTNGLTVRSDLEISAGVNLSFNLETNFVVGRNLLQLGGTMNLGTTARNLTLSVKGNFMQAPGAVITETGPAIPEIILDGVISQQINLQGSILNEVVFRINNPSGIVVSHSFDLPYKLELQNGIVSTGENIIGLLPGTTLSVSDSTSKTFINGRLRKDGLVDGDFMFPVGRDNDMRWVGLKRATGNFLAEYVRGNPRDLESNLPEGIEHISALEYWMITPASTDAMATVELSFQDVNSGGVTSLGELRVAMLQPGSWFNSGNSATTGSAGGEGSVTGLPVSNWLTSLPMIFTLASTVSTQNPLPITWKSFSATRAGNTVQLNWSAEEEGIAYYEIARSADGTHFEKIAGVSAGRTGGNYNWTDELNDIDINLRTTNLFYQLTMIQVNGGRIPGTVERVTKARTDETSGGGVRGDQVKIYAGMGLIRLYSTVELPAGTTVEIFDLTGRLVKRFITNSKGLEFSFNHATTFSQRQMVVIRIIAGANRVFSLKAFVN